MGPECKMFNIFGNFMDHGTLTNVLKAYISLFEVSLADKLISDRLHHA